MLDDQPVMFPYLRRWLTEAEALALLRSLSPERLNHLERIIRAQTPAPPPRVTVSTISSALAAELIRRNWAAGRAIEVPALGVTIKEDREESEDA